MLVHLVSSIYDVLVVGTYYVSSEITIIANHKELHLPKLPLFHLELNKSMLYIGRINVQNDQLLVCND